MYLICIKISLKFRNFVEGIVGQTTFGYRPLTTLEVAVQNVAENSDPLNFGTLVAQFHSSFILSSKPCTMTQYYHSITFMQQFSPIKPHIIGLIFTLLIFLVISLA